MLGKCIMGHRRGATRLRKSSVAGSWGYGDRRVDSGIQALESGAPDVRGVLGVGFGLGCGVGWGPGFGPEVVGFVGSGCGVGFSIGVTLAGVGIGLPASGVACVPCNVVTGAGQRVSQMTTLIVPILSTFAIQTWQSMGTQISLLDEHLRSKNQRIRDGSFRNQFAPPSVETMPQKSRDELRDFNIRSQVRFSTSSTAIHSPQQDVRSECTYDK